MSVNGKTMQTRAGYISALAPGVKHQELPAESFTRFFAVLIDPKYFLKQAAVYKKEISQEMLAYIKLPEQLLPCVKNFMAEVSAPADGSQEVIRSLEVQIAHHILRAIFSIRVNAEKITERADIDYVVEYINDNYAYPFSLEELADKIALSKSHFSRVFKKETGYTLQDYIVKVRLDRAKLLLYRGSQSITEIAHACGFSSSAHFSSAFGKHVGVKPSVYRKDASL
jgi:AraC family transcriptional regulator